MGMLAGSVQFRRSTERLWTRGLKSRLKQLRPSRAFLWLAYGLTDLPAGSTICRHKDHGPYGSVRRDVGPSTPTRRRPTLREVVVPLDPPSVGTLAPDAPISPHTG